MTMKTNVRMLLIVSVFFLVIAAAASGKTIYVDVDRPPGGGGTSWADAYKYLQDALADANTSAKPVEIRVAQGTYTPDCNSADPNGSGDREATFGLINGVTLKGGYAGESDPDARDVDLYETILSGDLDSNDVPVATSDLLTDPNRAENSYHVVTGASTDANAVLDGFIITAGNANETVTPNKSGAGIYKGSPTVLNCTFSNNSAYSSSGGMYTWENVGPLVSNCNFTSNYAGNGGGLYGKNMILTNCTFSGNLGGGISLSYSSATLTDCIFSGNVISGSGGGVYIYMSSPTLTNCIFTGNSAGDGGGMSTMLISDNIANLINCTFSGNTASTDGGGFSSSHDFTTFTNCTFSGNQAGGDGGGYCVYNNGGTPDFNNCILWGNTANNEGPQIAIKSTTATVGVNYSDVQGGEVDIYDQFPDSLNYDANNINSDPLFVDADGADNTVGTEDDNLRLLIGSPCIDAGDNTAVPADTTDLDGDANTTEPVPYDLDGNPRFIDDLCTADTGNGTAPVVDMGAYEFLRSDIDSDGDVNFKDFGQFALYWLHVACGACSGADLTCDGDVNAHDLKELADNWLW